MRYYFYIIVFAGRKYRENAKVNASTDDVASPKRKDIKLSINSIAKTEMASTKKPECVYRKTSQNKREGRPVDITSPTIKDFFQPKSVDILSEDIVISSSLDETKQQSPSKPVTPHRIVCLSPEKMKSESLEPAVINDNKRPVRNKKR